MKLFRKGGKRVAAITAATAFCASLVVAAPASAASLTSLTLTPDNPTQGATGVTYNFTLSSATGNTRCVRVHFGDDAAFGGLPAGMSFGTPVLTANATGFTTTESGDYVQGTNAGGVTPTTLSITDVTNPSDDGSITYKIELFSDDTCSTLVDEGVGQTAITENTIVSVTVDPSFTFTVANRSSACNGESNFVTGAGSANAVALGRLAVSSNASGGQNLTVSGNSGGGYSVYVRGTQAANNLRSAGHNWTDVAGTYAAPAALGAGERFGYTWQDAEAAGTVANPGSAEFAALDGTNRAIMDADNTASSGTGCISFDAQTGSATPAGSYTATVIYTAVPVF